MTEKSRILVVDDEWTNRRRLADLLKGPYQVIGAKNGEQALARVAEHPDLALVLLDVMMPDIDGHEVLRRLKQDERTREIPVIFITALNSSEDEATGLRLGAADYVTKPFNSAIVKARVENHLQFVRQRKLLEQLVGRDGLTEIDNRRQFDAVLDQEWRRSRRHGTALSLAIVDIDHFKHLNDTHGHAAGDQVLKDVAHSLSEGAQRACDTVARFGGEEFALLLPETEAEGGRALAEDLRRRVAGLAIPSDTGPENLSVTISVGGTTTVPDTDTPRPFLEHADRMLYAAKANGRNQVVWG